MPNHSAGDPSARPSDEFVPEVDRSPRARMQKARPFASAVLAPALIAVAPLSDSARRLLYLGALALVWSFIVTAVVRRRAPRRWTGIAVGTGLAVLGEVARTVFVTSGHVAFMRGADAFRIAAYLVLVLGFRAIVRDADPDDERASVLDGAIAGCALFAACWPSLAYPAAISRAAEVSGGLLGTARPVLAIVACAVGVRLLFRHEVASRLLFLGVVPLAAADLFESAGLTHSTGTGRGFSQVSALFAFSIIAI